MIAPKCCRCPNGPTPIALSPWCPEDRVCAVCWGELPDLAVDPNWIDKHGTAAQRAERAR